MIWLAKTTYKSLLEVDTSARYCHVLVTSMLYVVVLHVKGSVAIIGLETDDSLNDKRNQQIVVFLSPKYVLMENVADLLRFNKASLGRYAISRLVHMNYQSILGIMAACSYGFPHFRLYVSLWGAHPSERLSQFSLPTHEVIVRCFPSAEFEQNTVAYDEGQLRKL